MTCLDTKIELAGAVGASSVYTSVTAGTANAKGSYTQLIASTTYDAHSLILFVSETASTNIESFLIDIATGAGGAETVIIPNYQYNQRGLYGEEVGSIIRIPMPIPAGTRIAACCQCATASAVVRVAVYLISGFNDEAIGKLFDYGTDTANSTGTAVDAGATANTKGAWTQITSSSSQLKGLILTIGPIAGGAQDAGFLLDIGVGAAASEQIIIPDLHAYAETDGAILSNGVFPIFWIPIPANTRIAARCQCTTNIATYRILKVAIYGVH